MANNCFGDRVKLLVLRAARQQGIGAALMQAAEQGAYQAGKRLLVLDTATDEAERLYERLDWVKAGIIPQYALMPDHSFCDTSYYCKLLIEHAYGTP